VSEEPWSIVAGGERLRPYAVTGGRTRPTEALDMACLIASTPAGRSAGEASPQAQQVLTLCRSGPRSVAEIAPLLGQPVQIARVLLSDLVAASLVTVLPPASDRPDVATMRRVLDGLRQFAC
jgi:hypothetical protein